MLLAPSPSQPEGSKLEEATGSYCNFADNFTVFQDRFAYFLDNAFQASRSFFILMSLCVVLLVTVGGLSYQAVWRYKDWPGDYRNEEDVNRYLEGFWHAWTFMADPGTHADATRPGQRIITFSITLGGFFLTSMNIGVLVDAIREKMESLRMGRSKIIESEHTLILGWTQLTIHIIQELCLANASEGGGVIAVLAPESKEQMETELMLNVPMKNRYGTRIIIRTGSPFMLGDLRRVSAHTAKSIIILASSSNANESDANTVRTVLTLKALYEQRDCCYVIAEVRDIDNECLVRTVSDKSVEIIVSHDVMGRLMLTSVRQRGLSKIYDALLGFEGDEFYKSYWPELNGKEFGDLQQCFPEAVPIGVYRTSVAELTLNPSSSYVMEPGDELVVIAADNDTYSPKPPVDVVIEDILVPHEPKTKRQKILVCGWRRDIREVLKELDRMSKRGAQVHIVTHTVPLKERTQRLLEDGLDPKDLQNIVLFQHFGNTSCRRQVATLPMEDFTACMIFADHAFEHDAMYADSHSLATLLTVRDLQTDISTYLMQSFVQSPTTRHRRSSASKVVRRTSSDSSRKSGLFTGSFATSLSWSSEGTKTLNDADHFTKLIRKSRDLDIDIKAHCPIVCEILAPQTQQTIRASPYLAGLSDFCETNKLIGQVVAMVSEERAVKNVLDVLLGSGGCTIAVVPFDRFTSDGEHISFYGLSKRAASVNQLLIGYQQSGNNVEPAVLNPEGKDQVRDDWSRFDFAVLTPSYLPKLRSVNDPISHGPSSRSLSRLSQYKSEAEAEEIKRSIRTIESMSLPYKDKLQSWMVGLADLNSEEKRQLQSAISVFQNAVDALAEAELIDEDDACDGETDAGQSTHSIGLIGQPLPPSLPRAFNTRSASKPYTDENHRPP